MEKNIKKLKRSVKIYPIFSSFTGDIIFFVPIDTLFLTMVKGLNASQITAMTMFALMSCILSQKIILTLAKKIQNKNSLRLGALLMLISISILTFGKSFATMIIYKIINEFAIMFLNMDKVLLRNNLQTLNRENEYYKIRNKSKILYSILTMITAFAAGYLFNINNYLPMYLSVIIYTIMLIVSFNFYEEKEDTDKDLEKHKSNRKTALSATIALVLLSNAIFYAIIKMGQNNSKLFMQYDFQKHLSVEMVTYYITIIVFISRIMRLIGNIIFGKLYTKVKDKISIVLSAFLATAFVLLVLGHFLNIEFMYKVILMSLGFFLILAIRDSFQVYIEDIALSLSNKDEQQKIMIDVEIYRKIGTLIMSTIFTIVLLKYELIIVELILLILAVIEIFINIKLYKKLRRKNNI